jgi:hypothetical protein
MFGSTVIFLNLAWGTGCRWVARFPAMRLKPCEGPNQQYLCCPPPQNGSVPSFRTTHLSQAKLNFHLFSPAHLSFLVGHCFC